MGFSRPPKLFLRQDQQNADNPMGKTGFYDPEKESITLYVTGRHPKDIMRSLAHELQHHTQKCNGDFENVQNMGEEGYAQADPHMRTMEIQAYQASIVFRDWEDSTKGTIYYEHLQKGDNVSMSTKNWKNGELKSLLSEAWGFKMDLSNFGKLDEYTSSHSDGGKSWSTKATYEPNEPGQDDDDEGENPDGENPWEEEDKEIERLRSRAQQPTVAHIPGNKNVKEGLADAKSGPGPRRYKARGKAGGPDDCDPDKDATCPPEPSEDAVEASIADQMKKEGCGDHAEPGGMEMMVMGGEEGDESDVEGLAHELLSLAQRIGDALGVDSDVTSMGDDEELEERRARGRRGPSTRQDDARLRESVGRLHKAGYSKRQIKEFLSKAYSKALRS